MRSSANLAKRPAAAIVAQIAGTNLPSYVAREQARAVINAAATTTHRLLLEALWQSGGRVREVLRLRPCDLVEAEGALALTNLKQRRRENRRKLVYVSPDLIGALRALAKDAGVPYMGSFFRSRQSRGQPMSYEQCWRLIRRYALAAGVLVADGDRLRPANGRDFRHGAAVNQVRQGVPLSEVQQQLGHARIDSTSVYAKLANPERRAVADRVAW
jgi:integrase